MEEQNQNSVNLEIPSRWRRFSAYLFDILINIIVIAIYLFTWILGIDLVNLPIIIVRIITNLIIIFYKKSTLWNIREWIIAINKTNNPINLQQTFFRYLIFYPTIPLLFIHISLFLDYLEILNNDIVILEPSWIDNNSSYSTGNLIFNILSALIVLINIIEIFFKCPTFIDKLLWIKRIYKKSK